MKRMPGFIWFVFVPIFSCAQRDADDITDSIVAEGKKLYRSEMASWNGTDIFLEKYKEERQDIGGYFSYPDKDSTRCLFFSKGDMPSVLATISFDTSYKPENASIDGTKRSFTENESVLYTIRKLALAEINSDTIFKMYKNTNFNLIPLVSKDDKKVYVLTGPQQNGVVIFGNDYLITFDNDNKLISKKQLHKNIITINYGDNSGQETVATIHTHLPETGEFITATDICTLMLYEKYAKWKQHYVISATYVSIWDCEKNILVALTRRAWDKISKDQEKRHGK